ncbi:MAG: gliding motility-associated C-terminal domain-containing protein [Cyclobacteriaceae bacterium]
MKSFILLYFLAGSVAAQSLSIKGATVSIKNGATLSVKGDAFNEGILINNGELQISGMWQNDGTYDEANGEFTLSSNIDQIINHNAQSFNRLTITGGGVKYFLADLTVTGELKLVDGLLEARNDARIYGGGSLLTTGGSDQSHIVGTFYNVGAGEKIYPIGNGTTYLPVTINSLSNEIVGVSLLEPNPFSEVDETLTGLVEHRAWQLDIENNQQKEVEISLPIDEQVKYLEPSLAFSADGSPFTFVSQLDILNGLARSGVFTATNGVVTIGELNPSEKLPSLKIFNLVTPNGDGVHDFLKIENIEFYPENRLSIFNRWGDQLFSINGYDNVDAVFKGIGDKTNSQLSDGTYYYAIEDGKGKKYSGFFVLRN